MLAKNALNHFDGIGFILKPPYVGYDFDHCRCPAFDGVTPWANSLDMVLPEVTDYIKSLNSYTEVSPSGKGIRLLLKGRLPIAGMKKGPIEVYQSGRFVTITGHVLDGLPRTIENRQTELDKFIQAVFPDKKTKMKEAPAQPSLSLSFDWRDRLEKAFRSRSGEEIKRLYDGDFSTYNSRSEADLASCSHFAFWMDGDPAAMDAAFRASRLMRKKWDERHGEKTYGQMTIEKALQGCREFYKESSRNQRLNDCPMKTGSSFDLSFPDVMTGAAGEFAQAYSSYLEPPLHFFYICFLACLGSFLPISLSSELLTQPRLFVLLLGQSADDRKSTAITKTVNFFHEVTTAFHVCYGVGSAEGLQKKLKEFMRLLLCLDEFKQFVSKCKIDGSVLLPFVNTLFELNRYEAQTKTCSINLQNVHLSLLAASTIETYERTWDSSFTDIGFNNRLFIVPGSGDRRFSFPERVPDKEKYFLQKRLGELLKFVGSGMEIGITEDGRELYHDWYINYTPSIHAKRLDTYALRFMMLLTVNEMKQKIDSDIVEKVIKLMNWQLAVRQLHDPIDADGKMAIMEEKIRRILATGPHSDRDLQRRVHTERAGSWFYQTALRNLQSGKQICFDKAIKGWRLI